MGLHEFQIEPDDYKSSESLRTRDPAIFFAFCFGFGLALFLTWVI